MSQTKTQVGIIMGSDSDLKGMDSLFSLVQMPSGVPVATVAINNAGDAGVLAAQILGIKYPEAREKIRNYKEKMKVEVEIKSGKLEEAGYKEYLIKKQGRG